MSPPTSAPSPTELVARDPDRKDSIEIAADQQAGWRGLVGRLVGSRS